MTLSGNFEGLLSAMELEQSSKETLDYMVFFYMNLRSQLTTIQKSVLKRFGTLSKTVFTKLSKDDTYFQFQYDSCILSGISNSSATFSPSLASMGHIIQETWQLPQ